MMNMRQRKAVIRSLERVRKAQDEGAVDREVGFIETTLMVSLDNDSRAVIGELLETIQDTDYVSGLYECLNVIGSVARA